MVASTRRMWTGLFGAPHRAGAGRSSGEWPAVRPHPVAPHVPTPGKSLGQGINLIVVSSWEGKQLGRKIFEPRCTLGKPDRTAGKQIGLGNQARTLVGFRFICSNVDRTLLEALDKALLMGESSIRSVATP